jgi:predicted ATPase/class 3 adenylate cyclase
MQEVYYLNFIKTMSSKNLPNGTVALLFTDIEGSTKLAQDHKDVWESLRNRHHAILKSAIASHNGYVFQIIGDAFCAAFHTAGDALLAAIRSQTDLFHENGDAASIKVRMGIHTGKAEIQEDGQYHGFLAMSRIQRLMSAGHGGQVLISLTTQELIRDELPEGISLHDMGEKRLKDLIHPEHIFQLVIPGLPNDFPLLKTLEIHSNNLPIQATPFVARDHETETVRQKLLNPDIHLLTLTGPGGIGKTRLGLQVAAEMLDDFADGVFFVPLASVSDSVLVISTISQVLNVREAGGMSLIEMLKDHLSKKQLLLFLDNFEQVISAAPLVSHLLAAAPNLKVLVTSREILHIYGEHNYPVSALSIPDPKHLPSLERLTQFEAVRLFIQRAQAVKSDFEVTNLNAPAVAEICHRLDGLPLAIELAAARVRLLSPENLLSRLESRLSLLTGGARDLPARQQTLRGTIAWSYDLLNTDEKTLFQRLAVFASRFTLEAAEAVCNADNNLLFEIVDGVEALTDKSLLKREGGGEEPRFFMLETIREYAVEIFSQDDEAGALHRSHFNYFLTFAKQARSFLEKSEQGIWLDRLESEQDDLRAAILWARENRLTVQGAQLADALSMFWLMRGYLTEGRVRLAEILSQHDDLIDKELYARLLNQAGFLARYQCDYKSAAAFISESLEISRKLGDRHAIANALANLGFVVLHQENLAQANEHFLEALAIYHELNHEQGIADSSSNLALIEFCKGNYETAYDYYEESLLIWQRLGDKQGVAWALSHIGNVVLQQGHYASAQDFFDRSLTIAVETGIKWQIAYALEGYASLATAHKQAQQALCLASFCNELRRSIHMPLSPLYRALFERIMASVWLSLDEKSASEAQVAGQNMSLEDSINYARREVTLS